LDHNTNIVFFLSVLNKETGTKREKKHTQNNSA